MFGLRDEELRIIRGILAKFDAVEEAVIFGSRLQEGCTCSGRVEIALKGAQMTQAVAKEVSYELNEETLMTYCFSVMSYNTLKSQDLIDEIDREGVCLYEKK